jgi:hypothetical protein
MKPHAPGADPVTQPTRSDSDLSDDAGEPGDSQHALDNPGATMFSLVMLVWTRRGTAYGYDDYAGWMAEAGLTRPASHPLPGVPTTWLISEGA